MDDLWDVWQKVKLDSRVQWKDSNGKVGWAKVTRFVCPTSYIDIFDEDEQKRYQIHIESIVGIDLTYTE